MSDIVGNETLRSLWLDLASNHADQKFLIFQNRNGQTAEYTYAAFDQEINKVANVFLSLGVEHGERVAIQLHTSPEFLVCLFGLAKIGAIMVPMNEQYLAEEIAYVLEHTGATCAVIEPKFVDLYGAIYPEKGLLPKGLLIAREGVENTGGGTAASTKGLRSFSDLVAAQPAFLIEERPLFSDDLVEILFTSGTTSRPKGVAITHANVLFSGVYGMWEVTLTSKDRLLTTMPACHSNFQLAALAPVLLARATLIVIEKYSARRFWKQICHYRATVTQGVAMMLRTLMLQPENSEERRHCLREMLYFLPVSAKEKIAFEQRFGVKLMNTYGSTESIGWVLTDPPSGPRNWPSVGRAGLGYQVRIARDDGSPAQAGEIGEIQVKGERGRSVMWGYFNDPEETERAFTPDGWLKTGDKGYEDEQGWFFFVDRKANMIKRAGENISTTELEGVLVQHPLIAEAAVIGVPDPIRDQAVKAFVLPCAGSTLNADEVRAFCEQHMASFKVPSFVEIVDSFPRTCSMKIEKKLLR